MISFGLEISYELGNSLDHGQVKANLLPPLITKICGQLFPHLPIQTLKYSKLQHKLQLGGLQSPKIPNCQRPHLRKPDIKGLMSVINIQHYYLFISNPRTGQGNLSCLCTMSGIDNLHFLVFQRLALHLPNLIDLAAVPAIKELPGWQGTL